MTLSTVDIRVSLSIAYFIGSAFHVLLRAGYAVRSQVNTTPTRYCYVRNHWDTLLIRIVFFGYLMFFAWLSHPDWPSKIAVAMLIPEGFANWLTVPATLGTAAMFGFFIDVVLDSAQSIVANLTAKIPQLAFLNTIVRGQIPSYDAAVVDVKTVAKNQASPEDKPVSVVTPAPIDPALLKSPGIAATEIERLMAENEALKHPTPEK